LNHPPKILIIRFSSIGDIVLTTPVIRCLKQQLGAELHYLSKRSFESILAPNPYLDEIHLIDREISEALPRLKAESFDYIIDLHNNLRSRRVRMALGKKTFTFDKINLQKWLIVNFKINRLPEVHIVDRYLAAVQGLGVGNDGRGLDYFVPPQEEVSLSDFFAEHQRLETSYIAFVIGAAHQTKRLPVAKIISICRRISQPVLLIGGPGEREEGERIAAAAGRHVINTCGEMSLNASASLVRQASAVISHDTGFMHIAAAFRKPVISIWGNTIPEFGMFPYYPEGMDRNTTVEVQDLACRPCSKIGFQRCPRGHFKCMQDIDERKILGAIHLKTPD
jgi:ADP-heptose:LPS heptosyltransferase